MKNRKSMLRTAALTMSLLGVGMGAGPGIAGEVPESSEPIKLAMLEWTGQHVVTQIAGKLLQNMGYNVEYVTSGTYTQFLGLPDASITATLEVWSSNTGEHFPKAMASGNVVELGNLGLDPVETWFYNGTAQTACPGLPEWTALKECAQVFATPETFPKGRLLDYPADWGTTNVNRIEALGLPFQSVPAGSEGALIAEIKSAEAKNKPLLLQFWTPHWAHSLADLKIVTLPAYEKGCTEDPKIGINPDATYDCDWERGYIMKLAWVGMKDKWPAAFEFLKLFTITNSDQIPMMKAVDVDNRKLKDVVNDWIAANQTKWQAWIEAAKK